MTYLQRPDSPWEMRGPGSTGGRSEGGKWLAVRRAPQKGREREEPQGGALVGR